MLNFGGVTRWIHITWDASLPPESGCGFVSASGCWTIFRWNLGISNELNLHFLVESWAWGVDPKYDHQNISFLPNKNQVGSPFWICTGLPCRCWNSNPLRVAKQQLDRVTWFIWNQKKTSLALWKNVALFGDGICSMIWFFWISKFHLKTCFFPGFLLVFWDGGFSISWDNKKKHNIAVLKKFN